MEELSNFVCYDQLLEAPLQSYGWQVDTVPWQSPTVNWNDYEVVILRSCWDYQHYPEQFLAVLERIEQSRAQLHNSLAIVRWNFAKRYLRELEQQGIPIVPTQWLPHGLELAQLYASFTDWQTPEVILKPQVSATAEDTFRLTLANLPQQVEYLSTLFQQRPAMLQLFLSNIVTEGEYSLFYFAGQYSHTILKTPQQGDFRVQEEHGGLLNSVQPELRLQQLSEQVLQQLPEAVLYARLDWVRHDADFALMEVELIEPSLYFNMDAHAAQRFAQALEQVSKPC